MNRVSRIAATRDKEIVEEREKAALDAQADSETVEEQSSVA